jgi:hypothetical protein
MSSSAIDPTSEADLRSRLAKLEREFYSRRIDPFDNLFVWVCLTVGQVVSILGCAGSVIYPSWYLLNYWKESSGWGVLLAILGAVIGFFYSAAMCIVFNRASKWRG